MMRFAQGQGRFSSSIGCRTDTFSDVSNQHSVIVELKLGDIDHNFTVFFRELPWAITLDALGQHP